MKSKGYQVPKLSYSTKVTLHRALAGWTGYSEWDILSLTEVLNQSTWAVVSSYWSNVDTESPLATAPTLADVEALDTKRNKLSYEIVDFSWDVAALTVPAWANYAEIHVWGNDIITTVSWTDPDEATSRWDRHNDWAPIKLESLDELNNFKVKWLWGLTGKIYVQYYKVYNLNV